MHIYSELKSTHGKIRLRNIRIDDYIEIHRLCYNDFEILRWVMRPNPFTVENAREWTTERVLRRESNEQITFCIEQNVKNDEYSIVGIIYVGRFDWIAKRGEIAYWIAKPYRGRNIAVEAVQLLTAWIFERLSIVRLEILSPKINIASQKVAIKAGYYYEGLLRKYRTIQGEHHDLKIYSVINSKYNS